MEIDKELEAIARHPVAKIILVAEITLPKRSDSGKLTIFKRCDIESFHGQNMRQLPNDMQ